MINKKGFIVASSLLFITMGSDVIGYAVSPVPIRSVASLIDSIGNAPASVPLDGIFTTPSGSDSYTEGNNVIITENKKNQTGSIFSTEGNKLNLEEDFESEMYINIGGTADGIAFVMHNDPEKVSKFVGLKGNGLGIYGSSVNTQNETIGGDPLRNSFAIEFDTYHNGDNYDKEVQFNNHNGHIAYTFPDQAKTYKWSSDGKITTVNHFGLQLPTFKIGSGVWRLLKVEWKTWDSSNNGGTLTYKYGDLDEVTAKIPEGTFGKDEKGNDITDVYWGFNGSTGAESELAAVAFKTVPDLVNYDDNITFKRITGKEPSEFTKNSEVVVDYIGVYEGGKQPLLEPVYTFTLSNDHVYEEGTFLLNGKEVNPTISGNQLIIPGESLEADGQSVSIQFKVKNNDEKLNTGDTLKVGVTTKAKNAIIDSKESYKIRDEFKAPEVTPKIFKVKLNDENALKDEDAKNGVKVDNDYGASPNDMTYEFVTSKEEREEMVKELGVHYVDIKVTNEDGNSTTTKVPVIVHSPGETITDGFVIGENCSIGYKEWQNASTEKKQELLKEFGKIKGYSISGDTVTDVTNDSSQLNIGIGEGPWTPNKTYDISVKVNSYTKTIKVTLVQKEVEMTVRQVYAGTNNPIYSNLETKVEVKNNNLPKEVAVGNSIKDIMENHVANKKFQLDYLGYDLVYDSQDEPSITDYKIYQKGKEIMPTPTTVPDDDFTIVYEYNGQLAFNKVAEDLQFGKIEISNNESRTPLTDDSQKDISIINTAQNKTWQLKANLKSDIKRKDEKPFLGKILFKNNENSQEISNSPSIIVKKQSDASLYSEISLKDDSKNGLYLQQDGGNLKGSYSGEIQWTLEDTPDSNTDK